MNIITLYKYTIMSAQAVPAVLNIPAVLNTVVP